MSYEELYQARRTAPEAVVTCGSLADAATDNAEYHRHPAVSKSHLDQIARSPRHYWARYVDPDRVPPEPSPQMLLGTALHMHVLELGEWDKNYVVMPEGLKRTTKEGKAAYEALLKDGRTIINHSDWLQVQAMARAVFAHPAAAALLGEQGEAETTHMWLDAATGLQCKCRPDWLTSDAVVDLKTTRDASPSGFRKSIGNFRYHVQAAWYLHGLVQATGKRPSQFVFICVESDPPHAVAVYAADVEMIEAGWKQARWDLDKLAVCFAADSWPSYSDQIEPISLPGWMRPRAEGQSSSETSPDIELF